MGAGSLKTFAGGALPVAPRQRSRDEENESREVVDVVSIHCLPWVE